MTSGQYEVESSKPFSKSLLWELNRSFYVDKGVDAWRNGTVPHQITSNSLVGRTYAELIFSFLKDLSNKGHSEETVYILELGAGHGRLGFHILVHLDELIHHNTSKIPPYCYILSDIVEDNLDFFLGHRQFQDYFAEGKLEVALFDVEQKGEIHLRYSGVTIGPKTSKHSLVAIANYFFDSIPKDLYSIQHQQVYACWASLGSFINPDGLSITELLSQIQISFALHPVPDPIYPEAIFNEMIKTYSQALDNTSFFFPHIGLRCIQNLSKLFGRGVMLLSMDKGFHQIGELANTPLPSLVTHGSISFNVNYHAFSTFCQKLGGTSYFPKHSPSHVLLGCMLFLDNGEHYTETQTTYNHLVNAYGPDDFTRVKKMFYKHLEEMNLKELLHFLRMGAFDANLFKNLLPNIKQSSQAISVNDRILLAKALHKTWDQYFTLNESEDLAFEIAGLFYALGYYEEALQYFQFSVDQYGHTPDGFYNQALCYYQLHEDDLFLQLLVKARKMFPTYTNFDHLDTLDLTAE
ncbi:MAG: hypothetical protein AAF694_13035 [Bacteroidota bacterium]